MVPLTPHLHPQPTKIVLKGVGNDVDEDKDILRPDIGEVVWETWEGYHDGEGYRESRTSVVPRTEPECVKKVGLGLH